MGWEGCVGVGAVVTGCQLDEEKEEEAGRSSDVSVSMLWPGFGDLRAGCLSKLDNYARRNAGFTSRFGAELVQWHAS